jgi:hypothetical protein
MVLNNKPQMFSIYFPSNFFYAEVVNKWQPIIERMRLPYNSVSDFMNQQIQTVSFPGLQMDTATQQREQYTVTYPTGKELEPLIGKSLNITFKLTESYASYFIMWDQLDTYLHYAGPDLDDANNLKKPCWLEPITLAFLTDSGFQLTQYIFNEITPTSLSDLQLSYAAQVAQYNTFTLGLAYNRFDVK